VHQLGHPVGQPHLQKANSFEVVGEAADSDELLAEVRAKRPDLVLLEWQLPGQSIKDLLAALRNIDSQLTVIVLSGRPELEQAIRATGCATFFSLGGPPACLLRTLQALRRSTPRD
jgi:DNA-binding NarL/FixJ family response regulator